MTAKATGIKSTTNVPDPEIVPIPEAVLVDLRAEQATVREADQRLLRALSRVAATMRPGRRVKTISLDQGVVVYEPAGES